MNNGGAEPADSFIEDAQKHVKQPTAPAVSGLTDEGLRYLRIGVQEEARKDFAHLLNRGSWLE